MAKRSARSGWYRPKGSKRLRRIPRHHENPEVWRRIQRRNARFNNAWRARSAIGWAARNFYKGLPYAGTLGAAYLLHRAHNYLQSGALLDYTAPRQSNRKKRKSKRGKKRKKRKETSGQARRKARHGGGLRPPEFPMW